MAVFRGCPSSTVLNLQYYGFVVPLLMSFSVPSLLHFFEACMLSPSPAQVPEILDESTLADTGAGVIRLQSTEPDCRPSGFFASLENLGLLARFFHTLAHREFKSRPRGTKGNGGDSDLNPGTRVSS